MGHLRRLCKNNKMVVKDVPPVVNDIATTLEVSSTLVLKEEGEQLLQPHRVAAQRLAGIIHRTLGDFAPDPDLANFLRSEHLWEPQMVARVEEELLRPAKYNLGGEGLSAGVTHLLRELLKAKLVQASAAAGKGTRRAEFYGILQSALVEALEAFREQLPQKLDDILKAHVEEEVFGKLFLSVKYKTHSMWRMELKASLEAQHRMAAGAGEAGGGADGAQPLGEAAAPANGAVAGGAAPRRSKYERQACLWRATYRFLRTAQSVVVGQDGQNIAERAALVEELSVLQAGLAEAEKQYEGRSAAAAAAVRQRASHAEPGPSNYKRARTD